MRDHPGWRFAYPGYALGYASLENALQPAAAVSVRAAKQKEPAFWPAL
jgi:hypothetical protein